MIFHVLPFFLRPPSPPPLYPAPQEPILRWACVGWEPEAHKVGGGGRSGGGGQGGGRNMNSGVWGGEKGEGEEFTGTFPISSSSVLAI